MAKIYCKSSYLLRRDTAANWSEKNPILRDGEEGYETDTGIMKIGDGATEYNSLSDDNIYLPKSRINKSVDDVKSYADNTFANALKGTISDTAMLLDDVSPVTHEMGVKVKSKNLFDYDTQPNLNAQNNIGTSVKRDNGFTLTADPNATSGTFFGAYGVSALNLKPNTTYTSRATVTLVDNGSTNLGEAGSVNCSLKLAPALTGGVGVIIVNGYTNYTVGTREVITTFTTPSDMSRLQYVMTKLSNHTSVTFKDIQIEEGTTSTAYTPYVPDLTAVKVSRCGKNLIDKSIAYNNWTPSVGGYKMLYLYVGKNSTVTVSLLQKYNIGLEGYLYIRCGKSDTSTKYWLYHSTVSKLCNKSVTVTSEDGYITIGATEPAYNNFKDEIMVELGTTATDYEPYKECAEYTPTADGTVNGVTSLHPNTTLTTDTDGVIIDCEYNRDINKAFAALEAAIATNNS